MTAPTNNNNPNSNGGGKPPSPSGAGYYYRQDNALLAYLMAVLKDDQDFIRHCNTIQQSGTGGVLRLTIGSDGRLKFISSETTSRK